CASTSPGPSPRWRTPTGTPAPPRSGRRRGGGCPWTPPWPPSTPAASTTRALSSASSPRPAPAPPAGRSSAPPTPPGSADPRLPAESPLPTESSLLTDSRLPAESSAQRLPAGERGEAGSVPLDRLPHPCRGVVVHAGVLPQRPADGLAHEEVRVGDVRVDDVGEEPPVGRRPGAQLGEDRRAPQPAVVLVAHRRSVS